MSTICKGWRALHHTSLFIVHISSYIHAGVLSNREALPSEQNIGLEWIALTCSISIRKSRWFGFLLRQSVAAIDSREFSHWGHRAEVSWTCQWFKWFDILRHSQLFGKGFSELLSTSLFAVYCCLPCFNNICRPSNWDCVLVYIERSFEFAISNMFYMFYCWTVLVVHWRPQSLSLRAGLMHSPARL